MNNMIKYICLISLIFGLPGIVLAQKEVTVESNGLRLSGTLLQPDSSGDKVVLIITGSGPTDRNGNTPSAGSVNNCLKLLAEGLAQNNIASLRYDKRGVGKSISSSITAEDLRFEHYIQDAENWINFLKKRFKVVIVAGHSQGGLVGMIAAQNTAADRFISISGLTETMQASIRKQLANQPVVIKELAFPILDSLAKGVKVDSVPPILHPLFDPKMQDYFISSTKYDPRKEIQKLALPILLVQGTTDIQITTEGAKELATQNSRAKLVLIEEMNHVLKRSKADLMTNLASYSNPQLPLHDLLLPSIIGFILE